MQDNKVHAEKPQNAKENTTMTSAHKY